MDVKKSILCSFVQPTHHLRIIIATVAFGMGLDCSNIRRVIHWAPPDDLESYLHETGRAGRDGNPAFAVMYYNENFMIHQPTPNCFQQSHHNQIPTNAEVFCY